MRRRAAWAWLAIALVVVGVLAANARTLIAWALPPVLGLVVHGTAQFSDIDIGGGRAILRGVHVTSHGAPLLDAEQIRVDYSLRDLLPGSAHRFGLIAVDLERPQLTLERFADGTYNIALGGGRPAPAPAGPLRLNAVPLAFSMRVHDGALFLREPHALDSQARSIDVHGLQLDATIDTATRTRYRLRGTFATAPFTVGGTVDAVRGYAMHRVRVPSLDVRPVANFFINSKAAQVLAGTARDVDLQVYALGIEPEGPVDYHLGGHARIDNASMRLVGMAQPVSGLNGTLQLVDDQLFFSDLRAQVAGVTLRGVGSIFDLPAAPQFRLGLRGDGNLAALRTLFTFAKDQPFAGPARIGVAVDGGLDGPGPRVQATVDAAPATYHGIVFDALHATIAYSNSTVYFMPIRVEAEGSVMTMRGVLEIGDVNTISRVALHVDAPADALPYAGELLGSEPLAGDFMLHGKDLNFYGYGALQSARDPGRMAAVAHADPGGILHVAPLWIDTPRGTLYASYALDRVHDTSAFWIHAHRLVLRTPRRTSFLGIALPPMPPLDGTVDDAAIIGGGPSGEHALIAGNVQAHALTIAGVHLHRVRARFAGRLANAAIDPIVASGTFGTFRGQGALSLGTIAVRGQYRGTLQGLQQFFQGTPASGTIDGTAALALGPQGLVVQADGLRLGNASIHGVPISAATGTLAIHNGALQVQSARATIASGSFVGAGSYDRGLALVATQLDAKQLRALGLPLEAGVVDADGTLAQGAPLPTFRGGVALRHGRMQAFDVAGTSLIALHGDRVRLDHTVGGIDNIYSFASGTLTSLSAGAPAYDIAANVPAGNLRTVVDALGVPPHYAEGTFGADVRVRGSGVAPSVRGTVALPVGSVNGLFFTDASGVLDAGPGAVALQDGALTVATTHLTFNAAENPAISVLQLHSAHANLADFNNFFDTGDTLYGSGPVRFDVISQAHRLSTNGAIDITSLRYRNLPIGTTVASWSSARNVVTGAIDITGAQGALHTHGSIAVAQEPQLFATLRDSTYALTAQLNDVDLSTWIAAAGYPQVAVTGRINASGTASGRWPYPHLKANVELQNGTVWRFPIDRATAALSTANQRVRLDSASVQMPALNATAYGSMGFSMNAPLAFTLHVGTNDLPRLAMQFSRKELPVTGAFQSTLTLGGTPANPTVDATFDGTNAVAYGVSMPFVHGSVSLEHHNAVLRDASITLPKGTLAISGYVPVKVNPFGLGAPNAPLSFTISAKGIDPSAFDALVGNNTTFGGSIDGNLRISGVVSKPEVLGKFSVSNGSFSSDLERTPITGIQAAVSFTRTTATIDNLQAHFGTGTVYGAGSLTIGEQPTYVVTLHARGAQLDFPAFGNGQLDGDLALMREAGKTATVSGGITLSNASIPFASFLTATQNSPQFSNLPALDMNVDFTVGRNVRVRGSGFGMGLDIGAAGEVSLAGTLAAPTLAGTFHATNGTLTYFDRAFRVQTARVVFRPEDGVIPTIHATATTRVTNPDPNSPYSGVDVTVSVEGQVTNPQISFGSSPPGYSNDQILAMIAPFGGVLLSGLNYAPTQVPGAAVGTASGTFSAGAEAFNILNAQFAAGLLSPVEGALSQGLGLQNVNLTLDYWGNVGFSASRLLGRAVNFIYAQTFGIPSRTSFGLQLVGERTTSAQLTFFFENGPQRLFQIPTPTTVSGDRISAGLPLTGQQGFAFTFQRLFW